MLIVVIIMKSRLLKRFNLLGFRRRAIRELVLVSLVVAVGLVIVLTRAATPTVAFETEKGSRSPSVELASVTSASNGQFIKFKAGGTLPAYCSTGGTQLWNNLATCGWPDATNTGPDMSKCPNGLSNLSSPTVDQDGFITFSTANQNISCKTINGCVLIHASGVTIQNSIIKACDGAGWDIAHGNQLTKNPADDFAALSNEDFSNTNWGSTVTIDHVEIDGLRRVHECIFHGGHSLRVNAMNCHDVNDGVLMNGSTSFGFVSSASDDFQITDSYFHDFTHSTSNGHIDGIQTEGSQCNNCLNIIRHNTLLMTAYADSNTHPNFGTNPVTLETTNYSKDSTNSAIALWDSIKNTNNILVDNNLVTGGTATVYAEDYNNDAVATHQVDLGQTSSVGGFDLTKVYFLNNSFSDIIYGTSGADGSTPGCIGYYFPWAYRGPGGVSQNSYFAQPSDINLSFVSGWSPTNFKWNNVPTSTNPIPLGTPSFRSGNTYVEAHKNIDNGGPHAGCN